MMARTLRQQCRLGAHEITDDSPDWLGGVIFVVFLLLGYAVIALHDNWVESQETITARDATIVRLKTEIAAHDSFPSVVIEGPNFYCRQFHIKQEWSLAVASKCDEMAALIRLARAAP
jgi:hypothetical protein